MPDIIDIREFKGLFTHADHEDIPQEYLLELKNMRPVNGKLVKTFGMGSKISTALPVTPNVFTTYIHEELPDGYLYIAIIRPDVIADPNLIAVYAWNGVAWVGINNIAGITFSGTYYHELLTNPVIFADDSIRFLPGRVGTTGLTGDPKGIWLGYIDRKYFDELYTPTAGFFDSEAVVPKADTFVSIDESVEIGVDYGTGVVAEDEFYYKYTVIYDGVQESLLSDKSVKWSVDQENSIYKIIFSIVKADFASDYNRVTAIKLYRASAYTGPYYHVQTVNFLRESDVVKSDTSGAYSGGYYVYIPDNGVTFDAAKNYTVSIDDGSYNTVANPGSGTEEMLQWTLAGNPLSRPEDKWNVKWSIKENGAEVASGDSEAYSGAKIFVISESLDDDKYVGGVLEGVVGDTTYTFVIDANAKRVVHSYTDGFLGILPHDKPWKLTNPTEGNYYFTDDGTNYKIRLWDYMLVNGALHPLEGEKSIRVNGRYAKIIGRRLWQGNNIFDPSGEEEKHSGWGSYSQIDQYDVNPVGNKIEFYDREGGEITGIEEIFGNPVFMKKQAIITVMGTKENPADPDSWWYMETSHNIGNIAENGSISAKGAVYPVWYNGIYRMTSNNLAETDQTPVDSLRISDAIQDIFDGLTTSEKEDIESGYNQRTYEIVYKFPFAAGTRMFGYNVDTGEWREIETAVDVKVFALDENAELMAVNLDDKKVYSFAISESVSLSLKTKVFPISGDRKEIVRFVWVTYQSASPLTVNLYAENRAAIVATKTLPANSVVTTYQVAIRYGCKKFSLEIVDSVAGITNVEINRIQIEHD